MSGALRQCGDKASRLHSQANAFYTRAECVRMMFNDTMC